MTVTDLIQNLTSVLGVLVAGLGFYFVSKQIRSSAHSDIYTLGLAAKQALLEYPELRPYFFANEPLENADQKTTSRVETIASIYCLYMELISISADDLSGEKDVWMKYIGQMYDNSPAIRIYLKNFSYDDKLRTAINKQSQTGL